MHFFNGIKYTYIGIICIVFFYQYLAVNVCYKSVLATIKPT